MADAEAAGPVAWNKEQQERVSESLRWTDANDEDNPFNWPFKVKWMVTLIACYVTFIVGFNATSITSAAIEINERFGVSDAHFPNSFWPVTSWGVGAALAPMVVLPIMEDFGMKIGYLVTYVLFFLFVIPQAVAPNFTTLIVCRFFAGCCGGVLQDVMDGIIADVWATAVERSLPVTTYVFSLLAGVSLGPVIGGAVVGTLYWRWMFYIQLILYGASAPVIYFAFRETRGPVILAKRPKKAKKLTLLPASTEASSTPTHPSISLKDFFYGNIIRPAHLLCTEPVVFFFTLLSALSYGLLFMSTQSVIQVYMTNYGWAEYQAGLVQLSLVVGEFIGFLACILQNKIYAHAAARTASGEPNSHLPEVRLYASIPSSFVGLAGGLFWYGWTSYSSLPWILPTIGLGIVGFGSVVVMQAIMMYITDSYEKYAASASAAICFGENMFAACLPLAAMSMYTNLGFQWASTLLAFVALALSFAPVVLVLRGEGIRRRSPFMSQAVYDHN